MADWYLRVQPQDILTDAGVELNAGGEAEIRRCGDKVWKLYLQVDDELAHKIHWMVRHPPLPASFATGQPPDHAWPECLIYKGGRFAGYQMVYLENMHPLHELLDIAQRVATFRHWTYKHSVRLAANIAHAYGRFHDLGVVIGDVSTANILVDLATACCALIDLDSAQIDTGNCIFPCRVSTPDTTPPEVLLGKVPFERRTVHQDAFGIGVLVFQLLLDHHPYAGILPTTMPPLTTEQRISQNVWAYGPQPARTAIKIPPYGVPLASLPDELAKMFDAAFNGGFVDPARRPSAHAWVRPLERLYKSLVRCPAKPRHYFAPHQKVCPWCEKRQRTGEDSFADV